MKSYQISIRLNLVTSVTADAPNSSSRSVLGIEGEVLTSVLVSTLMTCDMSSTRMLRKSHDLNSYF